MTAYKTGILSIECLNKVSYNKVMDREKAEKIKKYCIKNGVNEHFFNSFINRIYFYPYKQIKALEKYKNESLTKEKIPQFKLLISRLLEIDKDNPKKEEWQKAFNLLNAF